MLDPCANCKRCAADRMVGIVRRADCLTLYPNLTNIGNSPGGFKAAMSSWGWSLSEKYFYDQQVLANYPNQTLGDLL